MTVTAIIAEYNPFHNGHLYQINSIREQLNSDKIIIIMSGNFTQRGIPAVVDKYKRAQMALSCGADLVIELPSYFALGSAEYFASGAVSLIDKLGVVDYLHFGSECGDVEQIKQIASVLQTEPILYKNKLNKELKAGKSFPAARKEALLTVLGNNTELAAILDNPNNNLGIEYVKALISRKSSVTPATLKRQGSGYNDTNITEGQFASASALRDLLKNEVLSPDKICPQVPAPVFRELTKKSNQEFLFEDDFSSLINYKLLHEISLYDYSLCQYYDITSDIADIFKKNLNRYTSFSNFCLECNSKNLTYARISRVLMHVLLDMTQEAVDELKDNDYSQYARILGFNDSGKELLGTIKNNSSIPLVTKLRKSLDEFDGVALKSLKADTYASLIYYSVQGNKYKHAPVNEYTQQIVLK